MQPVSGFQYSNVGTGVGTNVVSDSPAVLQRVFWGGSFVGSITIHDSATAAGTSATSSVLTLGIPLLRYPDGLDLGIQCQKGITYQATGTPVLTIVWSK